MVTKKTTTRSRATTAAKKKTAGNRSVHKRVKKAVGLRSFRLERQSTPFMTSSTSRETVYWVILGIVVIAFTAWIMKLQSDIQSIYDSIDISNNAVLEIPQDYTHHKKSDM